MLIRIAMAFAFIAGFASSALAADVGLSATITGSPVITSSITGDVMPLVRGGALHNLSLFGPDFRAATGAGGGSAVNVVTDYGADPTGAVVANTAFQNAINAGCNNVSSFQTKAIYVPAGHYTFDGSSTINITNACTIYGDNGSTSGKNAGGVLLRGNLPMAGDLFAFHGFGTFQMRNIRADIFSGYQSGGASYARIHTAGTGYVVNDTVTLTGGTFTTATVLKVTAVSAGVITGVVITTPGIYSVAPSSVAPVAQGSTSGVGINATFDMVYANAALISLSGPKTKLTADAASGATTLTVASITGFANGDQIEIEQDNGVYKTTTISGAPSGTTITLAAGLTFKASANHSVYDSYGGGAILENVTCLDYWDCVRNDNAPGSTFINVVAADYGHDGVIETGGAIIGAGGLYIGLAASDLNRGTSNAMFETLSGASVQLDSPYLVGGSQFGVLVNSFFGPTGTLTISGAQIEEQKTCSIKLHQAVSGVEYGNVGIVNNEFSNITNVTAQHLCVDAGTPTTNPKWIRNLNFVGNHSNDYVTAAVSSVSVQDGDNVVITGNALNNNATAGPTGISIAGAATHITEADNQITGFTTGAYGTMTAAALSPPEPIRSATLPTPGAGLLLQGGIATPPTLGANGEGAVYLATADGLRLQGQGSGSDISFVDKNGTIRGYLTTGGNFFFSGIDWLNQAGAGNRIHAGFDSDAAGNLVFSPVGSGTGKAVQFGGAATAPQHIASGQTTAPALTACGTGSPTISGTDFAGTVTMGTTATGCVITFNVAYATAPHCVVTWRATPLASQSYTVSNAAITTTQTSTSGNLLDYMCIAPSGG